MEAIEELKKQKQAFEKLISVVDELIEINEKIDAETNENVKKELEEKEKEKMGLYLYTIITLQL